MSAGAGTGGEEMKCSECKYAEKINTNRSGNGNSAYVGTFSQIAYTCRHPKIIHTPQSILFYGKTSPRNCPLKKEAIDHA
jgi:hypothetical protein